MIDTHRTRPAALALAGPRFLLAAAAAPAADAPLRIIVFGAHPDDCDIDAGGTAVLWAAKGHQVKFVSVTNGDAGHQSEGGGALAGAGARRRRKRGDGSASPSTRCSTTTTASSSRRSRCGSRSSAASASGTPTS